MHVLPTELCSRGQVDFDICFKFFALLFKVRCDRSFSWVFFEWAISFLCLLNIVVPLVFSYILCFMKA